MMDTSCPVPSISRDTDSTVRAPAPEGVNRSQNGLHRTVVPKTAASVLNIPGSVQSGIRSPMMADMKQSPNLRENLPPVHSNSSGSSINSAKIRSAPANATSRSNAASRTNSDASIRTGSSQNSKSAGGSATIQRKSSMSDLLARLTTPTQASLSRMRDPLSLPAKRSASSPLRSSSKGSGSRKISNPIISSPISPPVISNPTPAISSPAFSSLGPALSSPKRAVSSPRPATSRQTSPTYLSKDSKGSSPNASISRTKTSNYVKHQASKPVHLHISRPIPIDPLKSRSVSSPISQQKLPSNIYTVTRRAPSPPKEELTNSELKAGVNKKTEVKPPLNNVSPRAISIKDAHSGIGRPDANQNTSATNTPKTSGRQRRLSAPAPAVNVKPRNMSQAGTEAVKSYSQMNTSRFSPATGQARSTSQAPRTPIIPETPRISQTPQMTQTPQILETPLMTDTLQTLSDVTAVSQSPESELQQLREMNQSLQLRNQQLKARLGETYLELDMVSADLAVCQASRNSLQLQVNGYQQFQIDFEKRQKRNEKSLIRSQRIITLLKANVQDLKTSLEERELENYRLARQVRNNKGISSKIDQHYQHNAPMSPDQSPVSAYSLSTPPRSSSENEED